MILLPLYENTLLYSKKPPPKFETIADPCGLAAREVPSGGETRERAV
jgi:hypothetical protein